MESDMNKEQLLQFIKESDNEFIIKETDEKIMVEIIKKSDEKKQTLEELGFSFEAGM